MRKLTRLRCLSSGTRWQRRNERRRDGTGARGLGINLCTRRSGKTDGARGRKGTRKWCYRCKHSTRNIPVFRSNCSRTTLSRTCICFIWRAYISTYYAGYYIAVDVKRGFRRQRYASESIRLVGTFSKFRPIYSTRDCREKPTGGKAKEKKKKKKTKYFSESGDTIAETFLSDTNAALTFRRCDVIAKYLHTYWPMHTRSSIC